MANNNPDITATPKRRRKRFTPENISNHAQVKSAPNENNARNDVTLSGNGRYDVIKLTNQTVMGRLGLWAMTTFPVLSLKIFRTNKV
jgi:hypothetical protein